MIFDKYCLFKIFLVIIYSLVGLGAPETHLVHLHLGLPLVQLDQNDQLGLQGHAFLVLPEDPAPLCLQPTDTRRQIQLHNNAHIISRHTNENKAQLTELYKTSVTWYC